MFQEHALARQKELGLKYTRLFLVSFSPSFASIKCKYITAESVPL